MKKFGLLCLALVLALGALGVGYAAWTDTIFISGSVNTGEVCIEFTCPWSQTDPALSYLVTGYEPAIPSVMGQDWNATQEGPHFNQGVYQTTKNVGWTVVDCSGTPPVKTATLSFYNVYPCYFNHIGLGIINCGTIPVKLDHVIFRNAAGQVIGTLTDEGYLSFDLSGNGIDDFEVIWGDNFGDQIEPDGQSWSIDFWIHVMQDEGINFSQPQTFTFSVEITAVQWNGYPLED
jgi:hypothetical protein